MTESLTFDQLLARAKRPVLHLEMRDGYMRSDPDFQAWQNGTRHDPADRMSWWRPWLDTISGAVAAGVEIRRARIVSEPISEYIRYEYETAFTNISAGEQVRWLPRAGASTLFLPANDFWVIDDLVSFNHFTGDGEVASVGFEDVTDKALAEKCRAAFGEVWKRAIPHSQYHPA